MTQDGEPRQSKVYVLRRVADARDGGSHPRPAAASAAAPKLDRRTFLDVHTLSHTAPRPITGNTWSVTIHDFGKQWVEASWGKVDVRPGRRGTKGRSPNKERNQARARARAVGEIRRKCLAIGADHLVTLTYRENIENRERVLTDLEQLRRMLSRAGYPLPYVAVLECQQRGAIHPHLAVRGFQDVRLLRRCWYRIVGNGQGQVNVKGPRPGSSPVKLGRYLSKYVSKDLVHIPREFAEHRYFCSLRITVPTERFHLVLTRHAKDAEAKLYQLMFQETRRRIGDGWKLNHWVGGSGTFGWMSGYEDPSYRWLQRSGLATPESTTA